MYGDDDYLQQQGAYRLSESFDNIKVHVIKKASHEIMIDNPVQVCEIIK
jgi:pimeloyl-ACP methyl ester carboxylesterase